MAEPIKNIQEVLEFKPLIKQVTAKCVCCGKSSNDIKEMRYAEVMCYENEKEASITLYMCSERCVNASLNRQNEKVVNTLLAQAFSKHHVMQDLLSHGKIGLMKPEYAEWISRYVEFHPNQNKN